MRKCFKYTDASLSDVIIGCLTLGWGWEEKRWKDKSHLVELVEQKIYCN